jgi:hypothetical protein
MRPARIHRGETGRDRKGYHVAWRGQATGPGEEEWRS